MSYNTAFQALLAQAEERVCPCGEKNVSEHPVCPDCWYRAPREVRHAYSFGNRPGQKRFLGELLTGFARARAIDRDVQFSKTTD